MKIDAHQDLSWYFQASAAAMGICSSFEPIRMAIMTGGASKTSRPDSMSDARVDAASEYRRITERMSNLPPHHQEVIYAAYHPRNWGKEVTLALGQAAGTAVFSPAAQKYFEEDGGTDDHDFRSWLESVFIRGETARARVITVECREMLAAAQRAYEEA